MKNTKNKFMNEFKIIYSRACVVFKDILTWGASIWVMFVFIGLSALLYNLVIIDDGMTPFYADVLRDFFPSMRLLDNPVTYIITVFSTVGILFGSIAALTEDIAWSRFYDVSAWFGIVAMQYLRNSMAVFVGVYIVGNIESYIMYDVFNYMAMTIVMFVTIVVTFVAEWFCRKIVCYKSEPNSGVSSCLQENQLLLEY